MNYAIRIKRLEFTTYWKEKIVQPKNIRKKEPDVKVAYLMLVGIECIIISSAF